MRRRSRNRHQRRPATTGAAGGRGVAARARSGDESIAVGGLLIAIPRLCISRHCLTDGRTALSRDGCTLRALRVQGLERFGFVPSIWGAPVPGYVTSRAGGPKRSLVGPPSSRWSVISASRAVSTTRPASCDSKPTGPHSSSGCRPRTASSSAPSGSRPDRRSMTACDGRRDPSAPSPGRRLDFTVPW